MSPRTLCARHLLRQMLVLSILVQVLLPGGYARVQAAPLSGAAMTNSSTGGSIAIAAAPVAPAAITADEQRRALNAGLHLAPRPLAVDAGAAFSITATVDWWTAEDMAEVEVVLFLPPGVTTPGGASGVVRRALEGLHYGETRQVVFDLVSAPVAHPTGRVLTLRGALTCPDCLEIVRERLLGVRGAVGRARVDARSGAAVVDAQGALLESADGEMLLLVPGGVVQTGARFHYAERYQWRDAAEARPDVVTPHRVWLPLAVNGAAAVESTERTTGVLERALDDASLGEGAPGNVLDLALEDNGVWLFSRWEFEAAVGVTPLETFTSPVALQVDLAGWAAAGIAPEMLSLWTRATPADGWTLAPARLDDDVLSAELEHFSEYGLGTSLSSSGDRPPSTQLFTVDQLQGTANIGIPIDTPAGLGGLRPQLAFAYDSGSQDDLVQEAGDWQIVTQASPVGAGWRLDGVSYIARMGREEKFALVLNGQSATILKQDGVWRTSPALFARLEWEGDGSSTGYGQWTVTTTDGLRYEFGDAKPLPRDFVATNATVLALEQTPVEQNTYRQVKRWYLRRVLDAQGNTMEYRYQGEQGWERGCMDDDWVEDNRHWYTRALDPTEILWSRNDAGGVGEYKLRAQFVYDRATGRQDLRIKGRVSGDCIQAMYGESNRLMEVRVEALTNGAWRVLRSYKLTQEYKRFANSAAEESMIRLYLTRLTEYGVRDALPGHGFTYELQNPNRVMLRSADNGQGGLLTYSYGVQNAQCSSGVCPYGSVRLAVTRSDLADGQGGAIRTDYAYGLGMVANDGGFRSFHDVAITHYEIDRIGVGASNVLKWEKLETYGREGATNRDNPDPRRGRIRLHTVKSDGAETTPVLALTEYDWRAYWGKGGGWQPSSGQTWERGAKVNGVYERLYHPLWLRQEVVTQTVGAMVNVSGYGYDAAQQNGLQFGNVTKVEEWADGARLRTTVTEYFPHTAANVVSMPARVTVLDAQGVCVAETRHIYGASYVNGVYVTQVEGNYSQAPPNTKLVKTERRLRGGCTTDVTVSKYDPNWAITRFAYDPVGNQTAANQVGEATDGSQDQVMLTVFDSVYRLFPVEQYATKLASHREMATYYGVNGLGVDDAKAYWGALQEYCGVNELCTRQAYDGFGRPVERWEAVAKGTAWGTTVNSDVRWLYPAQAEYGKQPYYFIEWRAPRCAGNLVRRIYNGLGQLIQEQRAADDWQVVTDGCGAAVDPLREIDVDYLYDGLGRQVHASAPHFATSSWVNRAVDWSQGFTTTSYDALGRVVRMVAANGGIVETKYSGRRTVVAGRGRLGDADKVLSWTETDGAGNLRRVQTWSKPFDQGGVVEGEVLLTHDALGNLTRVALPSGGVATMTYDMAGRKVEMNDPDLGRWRYAYDRQDRLVRQTDAVNQTTCLYYDVIGRLEGKDLNQGSASSCAAAAYELTYTYDGGHSATNRSRGQVSQVRYNDGSYTRTLTYNGKGLLAKESVGIAGAPQTYTTGYFYDAYSRPVTTTYPGGEVVALSGFTARGLPTGMTRSLGNSTLVDNVAYDVAGRQVRQRYPAGSNVQRTWRYAPFAQQDNNGGALAGILVERTDVTANQRLISLDYEYDSFGNLTRQNGNGAGWIGFTYDAQSRLTGAYDQSYAYDAAGRMTGYEGVTRNYAGTGPVHAVRGAGYSYDANGNLTGRAGLSLTWNTENRLARATATGSNGTIVESYSYNDAGIRVKKVSNGVATYYPFPHYEVQVSASNVTTVTKYYFFAGQRVAMQRGNEALTYLHSDYLNSTLMATQGISVTGQERYHAYGKDRHANGTVPTDNRFTGQKEDATGLVYMNARYYDPALGQFVSPDTLVPDVTNLFDYNRYLYVRGNPLKFTDSTGHCSTTPPTPGDDDALAEFTACWQTAATIYNMYDADAWWQERFRVSKDDWLVNIGANPTTDSGWMQAQIAAWNSDFTLRSGLPDPDRPVEWHQPPPHPLEAVCNTWDCPAVAMDMGSLLLSAGGDALLIGCTVATEGACVLLGLGIKAVDVTMTGISTAYAFEQYYGQGTASDADLAIALTDLLGILPGVGEASGVLSLAWDLSDPWIDDESEFPHGVAK